MGKGEARKGSSEIRRRKAPKGIETKLPLGTLEEWLRLQVVKPAATQPEVQVPLDSYEEWIRKQTRERIESQD